jgi:hypothetical protein
VIIAGAVVYGLTVLLVLSSKSVRGVRRPLVAVAAPEAAPAPAPV